MSEIPLNPRQRPLWNPIWRCHEQPQLQHNGCYEKPIRRCHEQPPTPRQRPKIMIKRCLKYHWLQDNDLYENQYDDVMNNPNSKTTTFNNDKTMSKIPLTPRQRPLWNPIWRCHEQPQLQDNGFYEKPIWRCHEQPPTPRQRPSIIIKRCLKYHWLQDNDLCEKPICRCHEQTQLQNNDLYKNQYVDVMNNPQSQDDDHQ